MISYDISKKGYDKIWMKEWVLEMSGIRARTKRWFAMRMNEQNFARA